MKTTEKFNIHCYPLQTLDTTNTPTESVPDEHILIIDSYEDLDLRDYVTDAYNSIMED